MDVLTRAQREPAHQRIDPIKPIQRHDRLGIALIALGVGLIANSLLGPNAAVGAAIVSRSPRLFSWPWRSDSIDRFLGAVVTKYKPFRNEETPGLHLGIS